MTRWLVTFDDAIHEADTPSGALELAAEDDSTPIGATVFVIDLDAIVNTDRCIRMRLGGYEVSEEQAPGEVSESGSVPPSDLPGEPRSEKQRPGSLTSLARLHDAIAAHLADDTADLTELAYAMTEAATVIFDERDEASVADEQRFVPQGDEVCAAPMDACKCMKRKGHDGSHACSHGSWVSREGSGGKP